ncbi:hypothetical protein HG536_0H03140 [Torulaspora globosa]|uniref:Ribosomal RNA-processing protein 1 n=1 Tax=Torulaspora globosa TaxID=48254 RepID=A0A7G3ZN53_9SACH|nr:uncharacterized protein HG536_0H03140 [Torulaspora globosa]QLL34939.1 hypothetical protein HG536_0H03140 [Torulaspora globosa]
MVHSTGGPGSSTMDTNAFVKQLASNNRKVRENALETLQKYLNTKQFKDATQMQFNKLWKGLYFAMWFSDRPRPQQRLANELSELHMIYFDQRDNKTASEQLSLNDGAFIKFSRAFWKIICMEWFNIDRYRIDKYLMLVRRVLFNQLKYLKARQWDERLVDTYIERVLKWLPLSASAKVYNGVPLHIMDIILDEWERVVKSDLDEQEDEIPGSDVANLIEETPLVQFLEIFREINADVNNSKVLRNKIKSELLVDPRLAQWGVAAAANEPEPEASHDDDDSDGEDAEEWHGF